MLISEFQIFLCFIYQVQFVNKYVKSKKFANYLFSVFYNESLALNTMKLCSSLLIFAYDMRPKNCVQIIFLAFNVALILL